MKTNLILLVTLAICSAKAYGDWPEPNNVDYATTSKTEMEFEILSLAKELRDNGEDLDDLIERLERIKEVKEFFYEEE